MSSSGSPPSPQQLPPTWDAVASTYAEEMEQWSSYAEEALRLVPVGPTDRALDVAAGPGTLTFALAARVAHVDAVDFSPGMIAALEARIARDSVTNVDAAVMDAQWLELPDSVFDAAFCLFGFFFFPDRPRAFREMRRVLRPGGRALIATWAPIDRRPLMKVAFDAMAEALPQVPRPGKGDLQDPAECVREMSEAGFRDVVATPFTASLHVESAERYVELIERTAAPLAVMRQKLGEQAWLAMRAPLLEAVRRRIPEGGAELSAEAIFTLGTR